MAAWKEGSPRMAVSKAKGEFQLSAGCGLKRAELFIYRRSENSHSWWYRVANSGIPLPPTVKENKPCPVGNRTRTNGLPWPHPFLSSSFLRQHTGKVWWKQHWRQLWREENQLAWEDYKKQKYNRGNLPSLFGCLVTRAVLRNTDVIKHMCTCIYTGVYVCRFNSWRQEEKGGIWKSDKPGLNITWPLIS